MKIQGGNAMARKSINPGLPDLERFLEGRERKFVTYAEGMSIYRHCPNGKAAEAFTNLTKEVLG
jgi:hypothetical protein